LLLFEGGRASFIAIERIDRIEADRNYVVLHVGRERHRLRSPIAALSGRLDPAHFLRINRSTIVRLDAITSIAEWSHGDYSVVMNDGTAVMWSRRFRGRAEGVFGVSVERPKRR
jgi:two-component system LytT family response regulator